MRAYLTIILIGLVSAFIGIIPLFKRKADKYTVLSAFVLFLIMPYVVYHLSLPWTQWWWKGCLLYTSPSPRDGLLSRMPSSA